MLPASKIVLGTVQFGLDYGINNNRGKVTRKAAYQILDTCKQQGITFIDTAAVYGDSESILGGYFKEVPNHGFRVITKLDKQENVSATASIDRSLSKLNSATLEGILFHSYAHYKGCELKELIAWKQKKVVSQIGVSVYTNDEIESVLQDHQIDLIQVPFNLLDNANLRKEVLLQAKEAGKAIHVRSVFLQGLFFRDIENLPEKLLPLKPYLKSLNEILEKFDLSLQELALGYVLSRPYIDAVLIGVDSHDQLLANIQAAGKDIPEEAVNAVESVFVKETDLLYPYNW